MHQPFFAQVARGCHDQQSRHESFLQIVTCPVPRGAQISGVVGPNKATLGVSNAAAKWIAALSLPISRSAPAISAAN